MNSVEKKVEKKLLENEKEILEELKHIHEEAYKRLDEQIKELTESSKNLKDDGTNKLQAKIYQIEYKKALQKKVDQALSVLDDDRVTVESFLRKMYEDGYEGNLEGLDSRGVTIEPKINEKAVIESISKSVAGATFSDRLYRNANATKKACFKEIQRGIALGESYSNIAGHIKRKLDMSFNNAYRIARTEGGRVSIEGKLDSMKQAKEEGADIVKEWSASLDSRVRKDHALLDGTIAEVDEPFKWAGGEVDAPHKFGIARQDINCRCSVISRPRFDLSDDEKAKLGGKGKSKKPQSKPKLKEVPKPEPTALGGFGLNGMSFGDMRKAVSKGNRNKPTKKSSDWEKVEGVNNKLAPKRFTEKAGLFEIQGTGTQYDGWTMWRPQALITNKDGVNMIDNPNVDGDVLLFAKDDFVELTSPTGEKKKFSVKGITKILKGG